VSYGDSRKTVLPQTGITIRISTLFWQYSGPKDDRESIAPHIAVPVLWSDVARGHDAALEIALAVPQPIPAGAAWSGRMTLDRTEVAMSGRAADMDIAGVAKNMKIADVVIDGTRMTFRSELEGKPFVFEAVSLGSFVVGEAVFDNRRGNPFPFALRAATGASR
jgi:hypothetical protein